MLAKRFWILFGALGGVLIALVLVFSATRVYRATAQVIVNYRAPETINPQQATAFDQLSDDYLSTQMDVIRSKRIAEDAVATLMLDRLAGFAESLGWRGEGSARRFIADRISDRLLLRVASATSRVISISYSDNDPERAAKVANAVAGSYVKTMLDLQAQPARDTAEWYERRSKEVQRRLGLAQAKLTLRKQQLGVDTPDPGQPDAEASRLRELSNQLAVAQAQAAIMGARPAVGAVPDTLINPVVQNIQSEIARLEGQRQQLAMSAGPNNPDYRQLVGQLSGLRQQLAEQKGLVQQGAMAGARQAAVTAARLTADVAAAKLRVIDSSARRDDVAVLQQDVRNLQAVYDGMAARQSQLNLIGESGQANVSILDRAVPPVHPISPRGMIMVALGLLLGTTVTVAIVVMRELRDRRIYTAGDLEELLGISSLGGLRLPSKMPPLLPTNLSGLLPGPAR
jgi:uncharacterized protein involved in exopolysaccharide biosynthesis